MFRFKAISSLNAAFSFRLLSKPDAYKIKWTRALQGCVAALCVFSGALMCLRPQPAELYPPQPGSGLLFIICGISLALLLPRHFRSAGIAGILALAVSFLALAEHFIGVSFDANSFNLIRMDVYSAMCFILLSLALISITGRSKIYFLVFQYACPFVMYVSIAVLAGYAFNIPLFYKWLPASEISYLSAGLFFMMAQVLWLAYSKSKEAQFFGDFRVLVLKKIFLGKLVSATLVSAIIVWSYRRELITDNFVFVLYTTILVLVTRFFVYISSKQLGLIEEKRKQIELLVFNSNRELTQKVEQKTEEMKTAFNELGVQRELFFTLFRKAPLAKILTNMKNNIIMDCSDAYTKLAGLTREQIIGRTATSIGMVWDKHLISKALVNIHATGTASIDDFSTQTKEGEQMWLNIHFSIIHINKEDHLLSTIFNVTDRKKIENKYKYILQNASDVIYTTDKEGNFEFVNESVTTILGYQSAELIGKHFTSIIHEDSRQKAYDFYVNQFTLVNENTHYELKVVDSKQHVKWIGQNVRIRRDEHNRYIGFHGVARDITERKNLESDLQVKNERLEEAMRISRFGYFEIDMIAGRIIRSKETLEIFEIEDNSYAISDALYLSFVVPQDVEALKAYFEKIKRLKQQDSIEYQIVTCKGNLKYILTQATPVLDGAGNVILIRGTAQDITASKNTELMLRKAKEISEESIRLKDRFLANMSHEIRTPMNSILGFSRILNDSDLNWKQKEWLKTILSSGENLLIILNDILDLSKIESGMIQLESIPVSLYESLQSYMALHRIKAAEKGLTFELVVHNDLPGQVLSDPVRLQQIFTNLLSNAIKFTYDGFVKLSANVLTEDETEALIEFRIIDSGIGISLMQQKNIFERFVQESPDITRKYGGTGLGLSIVKELTLLLNGKIELSSRVGEGSEFKLTIPFKKSFHAARSKHLAEPWEKAGDAGIEPIRVLVAEDNRTNQQFILAVMEKFGIETFIVNNGEEAVRKLETTRFDLVLMDIQMPLMDGLEAARIIRKKLKLDIPIIALTANSAKYETEKYLEAGMNDCLVKPTTPADIYAKIKQLLPQKPVVEMKYNGNGIAGFHDQGNLFDPEKLLAKLNGDKQAFDNVIAFFLEDTPVDISLLATAISDKSYKLIESSAHKLISYFAIIYVIKAEKILKEIESKVISFASLDEVTELFEELQVVFMQTEAELRNL